MNHIKNVPAQKFNFSASTSQSARKTLGSRYTLPRFQVHTSSVPGTHFLGSRYTDGLHSGTRFRSTQRFVRKQADLGLLSPKTVFRTSLSCTTHGIIPRWNS